MLDLSAHTRAPVAARCILGLLALLASHAVIAQSRFVGTVTDMQSGAPIPDAQVRLYGVQSPFGGEMVGTATTDANGHYEVVNDESVWFVHLSLGASHPDYKSDGDYVTTSAGTHTHHVRLWREGDARVSVRLLDSGTLQPIPGTSVQFLFGDGQHSLESGPDGTVVEEDFHHFGDYRVCAADSADAYVDACFDGIVMPPHTTADATPFVVAAGTDLELEILLTPAARLRGRITDRTSGVPLAGQRFGFWLRPSQGDVQTRVARTDADGAYEIVGGPPGSYLLQIVPSTSYPAYGQRMWPDIACPSSDCNVAGTPINLGSDDLEGLDFTLGGAAAAAGVVTDASTGQPLAGIRIRVAILETFSYAHLTEVSTGADGSYLVDYLPTLRVMRLNTANDQGYGNMAWPSVACVQDCNNHGSSINLVPHEITAGFDFALSRGSAISGQLRSLHSGLPLPGVVDVASSTGTIVYTEAVDGAWTTPALPAGTYYVRARYTRWDEALCQQWSGIDCSDGSVSITSGSGVIVDAGGDAVGIDLAVADQVILRAGFEE